MAIAAKTDPNRKRAMAVGRLMDKEFGCLAKARRARQSAWVPPRGYRAAAERLERRGLLKFSGTVGFEITAYGREIYLEELAAAEAEADQA